MNRLGLVPEMKMGQTAFPQGNKTVRKHRKHILVPSYCLEKTTQAFARMRRPQAAAPKLSWPQSSPTKGEPL
jgi:hypothetical protein